MLPALTCLKNLIKTKSYHIDLPFFRLHYQATVCLLLAFCLILTAKVLFGDTIDCRSTAAGRDSFYDNMCYATGTYTKYVSDAPIKPELPPTTVNVLQTTQDGQQTSPDGQLTTLSGELTLPDVVNINVPFRAENQSRYIHTGILMDESNYDYKQFKVFWHNYYQYIPIVLFFQSVLFYFPHYLWKVWENGMISSICQRLHDNRFAPSEYFEANYDIIYYIQNLFRLNKSLVYKYYFCHILCLVNLIAQVIALNVVFNYQFITYGYVVIKYLFFDQDIYGLQPALPESALKLQQPSLNNPMDFVFPKITGCRVALGSQAAKLPDEFDFMCVLPLNILNDKFFLMLWFWFLILIVLTALEIIYDFMFIMLPFFRKHLFAKRYGMSLFDSDNRHTSSLPELFLLDLIGHNTDKFAFSALLKKLNKDDWTASPSENQSVV